MALLHDKNHRPIACETCPQGEPTMLQAYVDDATLESYGVTHIDEMEDSDIRRDGLVEGHCLPCNGPDDGDCGDSDES